MKLPRLFTDGLVIQQGIPAPVWGWSTPNHHIRVAVGGFAAETTSDNKGRWMVKLPALRAADHLGQRLRMTIDGDQTLTIDDVTVGEVWLCAGQSNMEWPVAQADEAKTEIAQARFPQIRLFTVARAVATSPSDDVQADAGWQRCSPATVTGFSAVAYAFGRELHAAQQVPIGLIHASWGGSMAEAWMSRAALAAEPVLRPILDRGDSGSALPAPDSPAYRKALNAWEAKAYHRDPGNKGVKKGWAKREFDDAKWPTMDLPRAWESTGLDIDGAVWFRRTVAVPPAWKGKALDLSLGPIDDFDTTYVNGVEVGATGSETPDAHTVPRIYRVPGKLVKAGDLVIAVRVFDRFGAGGLVGAPAQLSLRPATPAKPATTGKKPAAKKPLGKPLSLAGDWRYQIELRLAPKRDLPPLPLHSGSPHRPAVLNNAMVQPLVPFALRGALWYQGESNAERAEQYRTLLPSLIRDWRLGWGQGEFPFGIVQLAGFRARQAEPAASDWAELREAQALAARQANIGVVTAIDLGDAQDIHPTNKREVGRRLALWARAKVYGERLPWSGPQFTAMFVQAGDIRLQFDHADGLTTSNGKAPTGFAIAGIDRRFVWATARIDGTSVVVSSPQIAAPVAVRYAWADNPELNLVNGAGLPALPFRTDEWPLSTAGRR